jgi:hypothetical protein
MPRRFFRRSTSISAIASITLVAIFKNCLLKLNAISGGRCGDNLASRPTERIVGDTLRKIDKRDQCDVADAYLHMESSYAWRGPRLEEKE